MNDPFLAIVRTHSEVHELIVNCDNTIRERSTNFPDKTYEEGVATTLSWIMDDADIITPLDIEKNQ